MKKNSFLWAALSMTAALVMTACSNDDNANESPVQQSTVKTIPYTVTVNGGEGGATTRATVESDNKSLKFADGDKLYITGTNIKGVLDIQTGMGTTFATFSGDLTYSGSGTPAWDFSLTATLVSAQQTDGSEVTINATTGAVTVNYPTTSYCGDVATAVQKYSNLTGTSYYGLKSFELTQQTAFLNFVITFEDGTTTGTELSAVVSNNSAAICTANVTTVTDNGVKAKFVLPVAKGTTLSSANVKFGDKAAISFGASQTLDGKVYNVTKTQAAATDLSTINANYTAINGETLTGTLASNVKISIADGATVTLDGVTINGTNNSSYKWAGITCLGDATIILSGTNTVKGFYEDYPGIQAAAGNTLTINGTGSLTASSNGYGVGIGGGYNIACGNIEIQGGTITATGGNQEAGIGSGYQGTCGTITISGGTVTATGGSNGAAGIGSGSKGTCGDITITSGVTQVTATKGGGAPNSIGAGFNGSCGTVTIGGVETGNITTSPYTYQP